MALPTSRNTTYAPGVVVKSDDLNDIQDAIIGLQHGDIELHLSIGSGAQSNGTLFPFPPLWDCGASSEIAIPIPIPVGSRIKKITAWIRETDSNAAAVKLFKTELPAYPTPTATQIGSSTNTPGSGSGSVVAYDVDLGGSPETVADDHEYWIDVSTTSAGPELFLCTVTYDRV